MSDIDIDLRNARDSLVACGWKVDVMRLAVETEFQYSTKLISEWLRGEEEAEQKKKGN